MRRRTIRNFAIAAGLGLGAIALLPDNATPPEPTPPSEPICPPPENGVVKRLTYPAAGLSLMPPRPEDGLYVVLVGRDSTAHEAKIAPTSRITHINGNGVCDITRAEIDAAMSNVTAGTVELTVRNIYQNSENVVLKLKDQGPFNEKTAFDDPYEMRATPVGIPQKPEPVPSSLSANFYTVTTTANIAQTPGGAPVARLREDSCVMPYHLREIENGQGKVMLYDEETRRFSSGWIALSNLTEADSGMTEAACVATFQP